MSVTVSAPRIEHHREPLGIGEARPRISWKVATTEAGWRQAAYEIEVAHEAGGRWSSGRVASAAQVLVDWPAADLGSRERRTVRVRVWTDGESEPSEWSEATGLEMGLLERSDWRAVVIGPERSLGERPDRPPVLFRHPFELDHDIARARLYVTAHGMYVAEINGRRVGDEVFAPGWTSYHNRLRYQTYDVTELVGSGPNVLGATVAEGWFAGHLGFHGGRRRIYGDDVAFLAQLEVCYRDGRTATIATGPDWRWSDGPLAGAGIYAGETYDATREQPGWSAPGFDDSGWQPVRDEGPEAADLVAPIGPPIRRMQELAPVSIGRSPSGRTIVDFGQNLVGHVRLRVRGERGATITLRHAEVLEDGELATRPLRGAAAVDRYVLRGGETETWEPDFTYHGFRYVEVEGWPGPLMSDDLRAIVVHSDMERTGWFESSNHLLDRFHENVVWTMRGNFVGIPTDCPQRDERLGWGGDLGVFLPTATFLHDCLGMLTDWLADVAIEQRVLGTVPVWVPWFQITWPLVPVAVWGDVAVVAPWTLYERFGDVGLLETQFESMAAWIDQVAKVTGESHLWQTGLQLGDWLDPTAPPDSPEKASTDPYLIATAYHAWTTRLVAMAADIVGRHADARRFTELASAVQAAYENEYVTPNGLVASDAQSGYALSLGLGLLSWPRQRERAGRRLTELVAENDHAIGAGFVGARLVPDALADSGAIDAAYHVLLRETPPGWLYPVTMGATTVWERWDSMLPDGRLNPGDMLSFNHYALGAVADFLHRVVAGLAPAAPGYRRILFAPRPGGGLAHASATHETPYGRASIEWRRTGGTLEVEVVVPPGSTGIVRLPAPDWTEAEVGCGRHSFSCPFRPAEDDPRKPAARSTLGLPPESGVFEG